MSCPNLKVLSRLRFRLPCSNHLLSPQFGLECKGFSYTLTPWCWQHSKSLTNGGLFAALFLQFLFLVVKFDHLLFHARAKGKRRKKRNKKLDFFEIGEGAVSKSLSTAVKQGPSAVMGTLLV